MRSIKFIDLFCGMGGFRTGFEQGTKSLGIEAECVFSSDIKPYAVEIYKKNFNNEYVHGDINHVASEDIPDFDVLLGGFPCQPFSNAGKREGFTDTRGTLFFEIERILDVKKPKYFILENVEGLVTHEKAHKHHPHGETLKVILEKLHALGYTVSWNVLNAKDFGLAQSRQRIYIVGTREREIDLYNFERKETKLREVLEQGLPVVDTDLSRKLLSHFTPEQLQGKAIKDKRGGDNNISAWDIGMKGEVDADQKVLLNKIMRARRNKKWAELKGIAWMDGMPLTQEEIETFYTHDNLDAMLADLVEKDYLRLEHPKDLVVMTDENGKTKKVRQPRTDLPKGYNLFAGKLSYEINKILDSNDVTPTLVASDIDRIYVIDNGGLRNLTFIELNRLFGFPDNFNVGTDKRKAYDLYGNTVAVPIVSEITKKLLED